MKKTCYALDSNNMVFVGRGAERTLGVCCEVVDGVIAPSLPLEDTPEASFKSWEEFRDKLREESDYELCDRTVSKHCFNCPKLVPVQAEPFEKITFVNISTYPAPCQSDCIYCNLRGIGHFDTSNTGEVNELYRKVIDLCNYLQDNDKLDNYTVFQISSGEIAIHPFKNELLDAIRDKTAVFVTNCMRFDEGIARKLKQNPNSKINVSLDAGTPETWKVIKRRDNFRKTIENLIKYREYITKKEQIELKYIVMPGINTSEEDFDGIVKIMKMLDIPKLFISRDHYNTEIKSSELIVEIKRLIQKLVENNLVWYGEYYLPFEEFEALKEFGHEDLNRVDEPNNEV